MNVSAVLSFQSWFSKRLLQFPAWNKIQYNEYIFQHYFNFYSWFILKLEELLESVA